MKRIAIVGLVVIGIAIVFLGNYSWNNKVEKTIQKAEEKINSPIYKESLPHNNDTSYNEETKTSTTGDGKYEGQSEASINGDAPVTGEEDGAIKEEEIKPTLGEIKAEYYALFGELEVQETSKVDQLIVEAKADYVGKKMPLSELVVKYQDVANLMEKNADQTFNMLLQQLQYDLERNGYSKDEAEEFRQMYNAKKAARSSRIIAQIQDF